MATAAKKSAKATAKKKATGAGPKVHKSAKSGLRTQEFKVKGAQLLEKVQKLIKEGNVRKITIKDKQGKVLVEFPLTVGVVGVVLAPILAAVGALAALVTECTISVERK